MKQFSLDILNKKMVELYRDVYDYIGGKPNPDDIYILAGLNLRQQILSSPYIARTISDTEKEPRLFGCRLIWATNDDDFEVLWCPIRK